MGVTGLRLRPLLPGDEAAFLAAHEAMAREDFVFGLGYQAGQRWPDYLAQLDRQRCGIVPSAGLVPATFLVAEVDRQLVGRSSIRHELNDFLRREGGHIGYCVLAEHRRRGHATEMLRQSLVVARSVGVDRVLVTCDHDNVGSAAVIERCGGVLHSVIDCEDGIPKRRYWID